MVQWTLGALKDDPALCARYARAFKGTVRLGMCIIFTMDSKGVSYVTQTMVQLVLYVVGVICMGIVGCFMCAKRSIFSRGRLLFARLWRRRWSG
ncbi:hypothetical protein BJX64DRAFT_272490 [Aspergillus heterothallicus]